MDEIILSGRLNGKQHNRLKRLFDMDYKPSELADRIDIDKNQFYRVYIKGGCPHHRDENRHIWINGKKFAEWYLDNYKKKSMSENQAYCVSCKRYIEISDPEYQIDKNGSKYLICICPFCGNKTAKYI